jgi:hypothetical protein
MQFAENQVNIVNLDACRNNPLSRSTRSAEVGLAKMDAPTGSFIAYSTAPGDVAADGSGKNSPYTTALVAAMRQPGMALEETFRSVRVRVMAETDKRQVPWESSSLTGAFYFLPANAARPVDNVAEQDFFKAIKDSNDPAELQAYLDQYPTGSFAPLVRARLAKLEGTSANRTAQAAPAAPSQPAPVPAAPVVAAPNPAPAPIVQEAAVTPPAPVTSPAADGSLVLSQNASAQLADYLKTLHNRKGAFAVSEDGAVTGSYICEMIGQCTGLPQQAPENKDPDYPKKRALRQCASRGHGTCVVLMIRDDAKRPYALAAQ